MDELTVAEAVGLAHAAVAQPTLWPRVLAALRRALGAQTASAGFRYADGRETAAICPHTDPETHRRYCDELRAHNFLWQAATTARAGSAQSAEQLAGSQAYRRSIIFNEFIRPQATGDILTLTLRSDADGAALMSFGRGLHHEVFTPDEVHRAARLAALIGAAAQRGLDTGGRLIAGQMVEQGVAALICDRRGRVRHLNRLAIALEKDGTIQLSAGRLRLRDQPGLQRALACATRTLPGWPPPVSSDLPAGPAWTLRVMPWTDSAGAFPGTEPLAMVTLTPLRRPVTPAALAARFGLTPREAQVAQALSRGLPLPDIARAEGIALSTARSHVQRLFDKTGARSQQALIARLLSANPGPD